MPHCEDNDHHDVLENSLIQAEKTLSAVLDDVHHESEQACAEVRVKLEFILYDFKCTST